MKKLKELFFLFKYAGTDSLLDHEKQKRICIGVNITCISIAIINATVGTLCYLLTKNSLLLIGVITEVALISIPIVLNFKKKHNTASFSLYIIICIATFYFCCILGKLVEAQLTIIYLIGLAFFMFPDRITRIICIIICVLIVVLVEENFRYEFIKPLTASPNVTYFMRLAAYLVVIFLVALTFDLYSRNIKMYSTKIEISLKKEEIENQKKDRFISNATHEILVSFHSIFAIINMLYKVEKKPKKHEDLKGSLDDLRAACEISKSIIDNILGYEKYEAGINNVAQNQLIDIRIIVLNIVDIYKYIADERMVKISCQISNEIPRFVLIDELKIRQIIINLLHNAIKFTRSNTEVSIIIKKENKRFVIYVEDQGDGISSENINYIFDEFVTQNPAGLGLGLFIVKKLVSELNGNINVTSNHFTGGTIFSISIPDFSIESNPLRQLTLDKVL